MAWSIKNGTCSFLEGELLNLVIMKRLKFILSIGLSCCLVLSLFAFTANAADTRAATSSSCSLVNPPNSEITWRFDGNQVVWVTVENGNVLGVTATLSCDIFATPDTKSWVLLPYGKTDELKYDIFGNVPIGWRFTLSTISDAALIYGKAHWNPF